MIILSEHKHCARGFFTISASLFQRKVEIEKWKVIRMKVFVSFVCNCCFLLICFVFFFFLALEETNQDGNSLFVTSFTLTKAAVTSLSSSKH